MDAQAIKLVQESQSIDSANAAIDINIRSKLIALPKDFSLHPLEGYFDSRFRFRGLFTTKNLVAFSAYAHTEAIENSTVFISSEEMLARLVVNKGNQANPGHCDHVARVELEKTAPYAALLGIVNKKLTQKDVAEFIEDWRNFLTASRQIEAESDLESVSIVKALHAVRKITIEAKSSSDNEVRSFGSTTSSMESIDVKSPDIPPDYFHFTCVPYDPLAERKFDLRLSVLTGERTPLLTLRIVCHEIHEEEMAEEFKDVIEGLLETSETAIATYVGTFSS